MSFRYVASANVVKYFHQVSRTVKTTLLNLALVFQKFKSRDIHFVVEVAQKIIESLKALFPIPFSRVRKTYKVIFMA